MDDSREKKDARRRRGFQGSFLLTAVGVAALVSLAGAGRYSPVSFETQFWMLTAGTFAYVSLEIMSIARSGEPRWMIAPPVLVTAFTFGLNFFATNFLYAMRGPMPSGMVRYNLFGFEWMAKTMELAFAGVIALWAGYKVDAAARVGNWVRSWLKERDWFRHAFQPNWVPLLVLYGFSILIRLWAMSGGIMGYFTAGASRLEWAQYTQYIKLLGGFGALLLVIVALRTFSKGKHFGTMNWVLIGVVTVETAFGVLSGFKSAVVYPVIYTGIAFYIIRGKIPVRMVGIAILLVGFAYFIVEPLRDLSVQPTGTRMEDASDVASAAADVVTDSRSSQFQIEQTFVDFLKRQNRVTACALAIRSFDAGRISDARKRFRYRMAIWPVIAVVPRLIWPSKPKQRVGRWYNNVVLGKERVVNAVGMSSIGFLYIAGGLPMIVAFFVVLGMIGRVMNNGLLYAGAGGLLMFLPLLGLMVKVPTAAYGMFVQMLRFIPFVMLVQFLALRR